MVYNRKLTAGPGSSQYGLEVCKSLGFDKEFLELSNNIRKELDEIPDLFHSTKKSKYSNKFYVDKCSFCSTNLNLHEHHIQEQHKADKRGMINTYHKNSSFNLLVLCNKCHSNFHSTNMSIEKKETLEGVYVLANSGQ